MHWYQVAILYIQIAPLSLVHCVHTMDISFRKSNVSDSVACAREVRARSHLRNTHRVHLVRAAPF